MRWAFMVVTHLIVPSDREFHLPVAGGAPGQPGALFLARWFQLNGLIRDTSSGECH